MKGMGMILGLCWGLTGQVRALEIGAAAPDFTAPATGDKTLSLESLRGRWVVLFFYPRSFTPGCTAQACSLRDGHAPIAALNATVLGASVDRIERQEEFKAVHRLPFDLLADTDGDIARKFGVLGATGRLARRVTFIINPAGRIAGMIDRVQTGRHDEQVHRKLEALQRAASDPSSKP